MATTTYSLCDSCRKLNRVFTEPDAQGKPICGNCKQELSIHGAVNELSASALMTLVDKSPLPVVADFWAPWCAPCRSFAPTFAHAAQALCEELVFAKVDTQAYPLASTTYGIRGIPTLVLFEGGFERSRISGAMSPPAFHAWIRKSVPRRARSA